MSDGGQQLKDQGPQTVDERLAALERQVLVYQDRISKYDQFVKDSAVHTDLISSLSDAQDAHITITGVNNQITSTALELLKSKDEENLCLMTSQAFTIDRMKTAHVNLSNSIDSRDKLIRGVVDVSIDEALKQISYKVDINDFEAYKNVMAAAIKLHETSLKQLEQAIVSIRDQSFSYREHLSNMRGDIILLQSALNDAVESISYQKIAQDKVKALIDKSCNDVILQIEKRISDLKILPQQVIPVDDIKAEIQSKIDLVALDGQNATVRSLNAEQKIMIIEKKIENITLLLKR